MAVRAAAPPASTPRPGPGPPAGSRSGIACPTSGPSVWRAHTRAATATAARTAPPAPTASAPRSQNVTPRWSLYIGRDLLSTAAPAHRCEPRKPGTAGNHDVRAGRVGHEWHLVSSRGQLPRRFQSAVLPSGTAPCAGACTRFAAVPTDHAPFDYCGQDVSFVVGAAVAQLVRPSSRRRPLIWPPPATIGAREGPRAWIGKKIPTVAFPFTNYAHAAHPAFAENIEKLRSWGVRVLFGPDVYPRRGPAASTLIATRGI